MYMNVTYLNLVLGIPLTHLHHQSAFLQVLSVKPSVISAYPGIRNRLIDLGLPTYIDK